MLYILLEFVFIFIVETGCIQAFDPFMDSNLHAIDWTGSNIDQNVGDNVVVMKTVDNEKYQCILPRDPSDNKEDAKHNYHGPTPEELLEALFTQSSCSYRIESYWTYELCHGKHLRQYHENKELSQKKVQTQEFFLGFAPKKKDEEIVQTESGKPIEKDSKIKSRKIDGITLPYFEFNMTDGTICDLINQPRKARLQYICQPDGRGEIYEFKETSSCEYEVIILTSALCSHPEFKPKNPPVNKISCHALDGSPIKPKELTKWNKERGEFDAKVEFIKHVTTQAVDDVDEDDLEPSTVDQKPSVDHHVDTKLSETTDKQVLREFLSGDYCLQGGTGWWLHEFCYGRYARQFHDDKEGRAVVILGRWNEKKHLQWLKSNPSKVPKPVGSRKSLSLLYTEGDICDVTGKKRFVEVRLKCIENVNQPHAVSIYLIEPKTCEYILGVESNILCPVIDKADNNGLIKDIKI